MSPDEATVPTLGDGGGDHPYGTAEAGPRSGPGLCRSAVDQAETAARSLAPSSWSTLVQYWKKRSRISSIVMAWP